MESLLVGKKKRLDKDKQEKLDELKARVERHRFHIRKLETVLRMLDNMSVEVKKVLLKQFNYNQLTKILIIHFLDSYYKR